MLRSGTIRAARTRLATSAGVTALAVATAMFLHSPDGSTTSAPTDLGGIMAAVAQQSSMAATAAGSSDYFLKMDGIPGESRVKGHENQIDIPAFSWGASNSGTAAAGGGAGAGKVKFSDFSFTKTLDKASPLILQAVASGKHIPTITLYGVSTGERAAQYLTITLSDVLISSYQDSGSTGGGGPTDSFTVNFAKISFDYKPQNVDGSLGTAVHAGWDVKNNKAA